MCFCSSESQIPSGHVEMSGVQVEYIGVMEFPGFSSPRHMHLCILPNSLTKYDIDAVIKWQTQ